MTKDEATKKAQKLWGCNAAAQEGDNVKFLIADYPYTIMGQGETWEAAFACHIAKRLLGSRTHAS